MRICELCRRRLNQPKLWSDPFHTRRLTFQQTQQLRFFARRKLWQQNLLCFFEGAHERNIAQGLGFEKGFSNRPWSTRKELRRGRRGGAIQCSSRAAVSSRWLPGAGRIRLASGVQRTKPARFSRRWPSKAMPGWSRLTRATAPLPPWISSC